MTSACFSRGHTGFSRNATLVATVNPPALAGGVFNQCMQKINNFTVLGNKWETFGQIKGGASGELAGN